MTNVPKCGETIPKMLPPLAIARSHVTGRALSGEPLLPGVRKVACVRVGGSSQADHLMRNAAMDDSIGGS